MDFFRSPHIPNLIANGKSCASLKKLDARKGVERSCCIREAKSKHRSIALALYPLTQ